MPSRLIPDPLLYVHPAGQCERNVFYSDKHVDHRFNIYYNSTRVAGGNPVLVIVHGGSWNANEKTGFVEVSSSASLGAFWFAYFLDSANYGTTAYFDVVSVEYSCHTHDGSTTAYEPYVNVSGGFNVLAISYPTYGKAVDDVQRALQYMADIAGRPPGCPDAVANGWTDARWNRNQLVLACHSVGACTGMVAAFKPSRPWNPHASGEFQARHEAKVRGVINWEGEVDLDPRFMYYRHAKHMLGKVQFDGAQMLADVNREMLDADVAGSYSSAATKTQRCKEFSPVDAIAMYAAYKPHLRVRSHYLRNFGSVSSPPPPYGYNAETPPPSAGPEYVSIPPYDAFGHDWRQFAIIEAACVAGGIAHTGFVINGADFPIVTTAGPLYTPDLQMGWESTLAPSYADAVAWIADD